MPILNYTTSISEHRTVGEIQQILAKAGAKAVSIDYGEQGEPIALTFLVEIQGTMVNFRLPTRYDGVLKKLVNDPNVPKKFKDRSQALRVSWRIIKDWVEAQLAIIEAGQAELAEVFLPYAVTPSGRTLFNEVMNTNLLGSGA